MEISMKQVGALSVIIAAAVGWQTLGWPRPALNTEVEIVGNYGKGTRALLLRSDRTQKQRELRRLKERARKEPANRDLQERIQDKREDIQELREQIRKLK